MTKKICIEAAMHFAVDALKKADVPVGHHDLSRGELVVTFPDFCAVSRAEGSAGAGFDTVAPKPLDLSPYALLIFLDRIRPHLPRALGVTDHDGLIGLWHDAIRECARGNTCEPPPEAVAALQQYADENPPEQPDPRRTPAKRVGTSEVQIQVRRVPKRMPKRKPSGKAASA